MILCAILCLSLDESCPESDGEDEAGFISETLVIYQTTRAYVLDQWFPTFFHLCTRWEPISLYCTLHTSSATRHNVQLISHLLTCILSYTVDVCAFFRHYSIFFRVPLNIPWGYTYPRLGITVLDDRYPRKTYQVSIESFIFGRSLMGFRTTSGLTFQVCRKPRKTCSYYAVSAPYFIRASRH